MTVQIPGLPIATSLFIISLLAGMLVVWLARLNDQDDFEIREGLTLSGIITAGGLLYIDYLKFTDQVPVEVSNSFLAWINSGVIEVAGLTKFFAVLVIAWKLIDYKFPGKFEFFQKVTG